jgi:hypothetical protein
VTPVGSAILEQAVHDPVLWDEGVEAARNACVAGAPLAAAAITAAAWYDNPLTGGRALLAAFACFEALSPRLDAWLAALAPTRHPETGDPAFVAGFGFVSERAAALVLQVGARLHEASGGPKLGFFLAEQRVIAQRAGALNLTGLCALVFADAGFDADQAERHYLLLRLAPALAAAQRARRAGLAQFPFFEHDYTYEGRWPSTEATEPCSEARLLQLKRAVGLD